MKLRTIEFSKLILFVVCIQFSLIGIIILEYNGFKFPFLRQIIAFFYLTFLPGIIILKILDLDCINVENLIFSVALSLIFLMCTGLIINILAILFNIQNAFSIINLVIINFTALIILITGLLFKEKFKEKNNKFSFHHERGNNILNKWILLTILIPFFSICGAYLVNRYSNNFLLILMLLILPSFFLLINSKGNEKGTYPLFHLL